MKKIIAFIISLIIVIVITLLIMNKVGIFNTKTSNIFNKETTKTEYKKPEINQDHTFIEAYSKTVKFNKQIVDLLAYYYYDEIDNSNYTIDEETNEEIKNNDSKAYYLIRELYLNDKPIGEISKIDYQSDNNFKELAKEEFDSIKTSVVKDITNEDEYLTIKLTDNTMNTGIEHVKTSSVYIINKDLEELISLPNGNTTGYVNIPIYKEELEDRNYLNGINTFNKMYNTNYDYLLYSENGYVDILKNKIYYIDVNASKCEIDEHEIKISNGEILDSFVKTYPDVSEYVTGESYC